LGNGFQQYAMVVSIKQHFSKISKHFQNNDCLGTINKKVSYRKHIARQHLFHKQMARAGLGRACQNFPVI